MTDDPETLTEDHWRQLRERNAQREQTLLAQGVRIPSDALVRQTWLEHILRHLAGDEAVLACRIDTQVRIAEMLDQADAQMLRAKLLDGVNGSG